MGLGIKLFIDTKSASGYNHENINWEQEAILLKDLILTNRSYRRFYPDTAVSYDTLKELVDLARLSASAGNRQPLKFILSCDKAKNEIIFPCVGLANDTADGDRPSAYIIIMGDTAVHPTFNCDHGIAAQAIMLGAVEKGLGGCIVGNVKRDELRLALNIPARYEILLALALGKPKETAAIEKIGPDGGFRGWWDDNGVRHVPKRQLNDSIVGVYSG